MKEQEYGKSYEFARNKSWETLIKYKISALPTDVHYIFNEMNVYVLPYTNAKRIIKAYNLFKHAKSNDGFVAKIEDKYIVFYNDKVRPASRVRFTLAHELGHIVLGHLDEENEAFRNGVTLWNRAKKKEPNTNEALANIYASRVLAPACVLYELNIHKRRDIAKLCGLSKQASRIRAKRMEELYKRNKFYKHPLERKVIQNFVEFIDNYKLKE